MTPQFWQAVLTAELAPGKGRALIKELGPLHESALPKLLSHPLLSRAERGRLASLDMNPLESALRQGARPVEFSEYPEPLRAWPDNPIALFAWGDWHATHAPTVGIVGTRNATNYGKAVAAKFAEALARAGVSVVSGGARGIDAAAHKAVVAAKGKTVAVLAGGVDRVYPSVHAGLFQQIRTGHGCLVSQFACGTKPDYYRFLIRNQLIAALSKIILVIEAPEKSGALSTAHRANELGREVFVVPANIDNPNFRGSHALIRDGAPLVDHPDQLLEALGIEPQESIPDLPPLSAIGTQLMEVLSAEPLAPDFIQERTGLPIGEIMSELTMLEMDGYVTQSSGGFARKL